jgi:hypothetical protein
MKTYLRPFTVSEKKALRDEVAWTPGMRAFLIACAVLLLFFFHFIHSKLAFSSPLLASDYWWIASWTILMGLLYYSSEWSSKGGRVKRRELLNGQALCCRVEAVDAIEVLEQEDEGPSFFVETAEGEVILFRGQFLDRWKGKKFPRKTFEIVETPESKTFLGFSSLGEPLPPSFVRQPLTYDEAKKWGFNWNYKVLDTDFDGLKVNKSTGFGISS